MTLNTPPGFIQCFVEGAAVTDIREAVGVGNPLQFYLLTFAGHHQLIKGFFQFDQLFDVWTFTEDQRAHLAGAVVLVKKFQRVLNRINDDLQQHNKNDRRDNADQQKSQQHRGVYQAGAGTVTMLNGDAKGSCPGIVCYAAAAGCLNILDRHPQIAECCGIRRLCQCDLQAGDISQNPDKFRIDTAYQNHPAVNIGTFIAQANSAG